MTKKQIIQSILAFVLFAALFLKPFGLFWYLVHWLGN